jgi:hypothetical protein
MPNDSVVPGTRAPPEQGDRKGPHPTQHHPRPYKERVPLSIVVMGRCGVGTFTVALGVLGAKI